MTVQKKLSGSFRTDKDSITVLQHFVMRERRKYSLRFSNLKTGSSNISHFYWKSRKN